MALSAAPSLSSSIISTIALTFSSSSSSTPFVSQPQRLSFGPCSAQLPRAQQRSRASAEGANFGASVRTPRVPPSARAAVGAGSWSGGGGTSIHRLLDENAHVVLPGVYDALSALVVERTGFQAGFISGYATSASLLGKPDFGLLTPTEMCTTARHVCAAAPRIPIVVDADTGGGNALNVQRTVRDLMAAGAAGCFLEDQVWPKKCGHMRGKQVIPAEEHAVKIRAARDAIGDADFFLVARTDARATSARTGLEEAIYRVNLYMEAGADASFVEAPRDVGELREIGLRTKGPRVCNMLEGGVTPLLTAGELADLGFQLIVHPLMGLYAATRSLINICRELKDNGTTRNCLDQLTTWDEFSSLVELESWFATEAKYSAKPKELVEVSAHQ